VGPSAASLLDRLDLIRMRPGMYLGANAPNHGVMLDRLDTWIVGYSEAVRIHRIRDPGLEHYESFWQFLEKRLGRSMEKGTIPTIRMLCVNDAEAWETYWRLLEEFRATVGAG
jgi:hypothetical protein